MSDSVDNWIAAICGFEGRGAEEVIPIANTV